MNFGKGYSSDFSLEILLYIIAVIIENKSRITFSSYVGIMDYEILGSLRGEVLDFYLSPRRKS